MAKKSKKSSKRNPVNTDNIHDIGLPASSKVLKPRNEEQKSYINKIKNNTITVATGDPGTGKTFIPSVLAAIELLKGKSSDFDKLILIRPNEPLGNSLGMLPGTLEEKLEPWLVPIADGISWYAGETYYKYCIRSGKIDYLAVEHARGRTFNNAFVIVDEAQNIGVEAMKAIVTRVGLDCRLVICGDIAQVDINKKDSGLAMLMRLKDKYGSAVPFTHIELVDNVRSSESAQFVKIFKEEGLM